MADTRSSAEKQLSRIEKRVAKRGSGFKFTPTAVERLNQLEAQLRAKMINDKGLQIGFGQVTTFLEELANMTPEQQAAKRAEIRKQAEDVYAGYFERKRSRAQEDFDTYITRLNRDYKFATADEEAALKEKMAGLDRDTAQAVGAAFRNVINRGLGASGALQQIANQIIQQRHIAADQVQQISEIAMRNLNTLKADRSNDMQRAMLRNIEDVKDEEAVTIRSEESNILNDIIQRDLLLQASAGVNQLVPRRVADTTDTTNDPLDPFQVRMRNLTQPSTTRPVTEPTVGSNLQNRVQERRNARIARANLAANAR